MTPVLKHDRGTLVMREVPKVVAHLCTFPDLEREDIHAALPCADRSTSLPA